MLGNRSIINIPPGVNKEDNTLTSFIYTDADKIRFYQGLPEKIGGWVQVVSTNTQTLTGVPRTIYSYIDNNGLEHVLIGTNTRLYSFENGAYYNITPLVTSTTAIANSLKTNFGTLANNPIITSTGSNVVTIPITPFSIGTFKQGDIITLSGVTGNPGGIANANLTGLFSINTVLPSAILINAKNNVVATSGVTGGGNAVVVATQVISVSQMAHGFSNGDRIKILAATAFGGFTIGDLNVEAVIRNVTTNAYDYYLTQSTDFATSSVSNGGGASTTVQGQIAAGTCSFAPISGYGGGLYGKGTYGTGKPFSEGFFPPQIWSIDRYGDSVVMTPGNQGGVYQWMGDINTAPVLITNAPAAVDYLFVAQAENVIVTFGAGGTTGRILTSDSSDITNWTVSGTSLVFDRTIQGAATLIAHSYVKGQYLLFTANAVYTMFFVDKPDIWVIRLLTETDGLIGQNAVMALPDTVVWQGSNDLYIYNGSVISQIQNNTLLHWMFDNINWTYAGICFARKVMEFNEVWWFFPTGTNTECDSYIIWNYQEGHFTNGRLSRTAAETPTNPTREQYLANGSCTGSPASALYQHETGYSDNTSSMTGSLTTNYAVMDQGDYVQNISAIIPSNYLLPIGTVDSGQDLYTLTVNTKDYDGQVTPRVFGSYNVSTTSRKIDVRISGRQRQYIYNFSNTTGFRIEKSYEMGKPYTVR